MRNKNRVYDLIAIRGLSFFFVVTLFLCSSCYAFNWEKCDKKMRSVSPFGFFISTSSYVTSTGDCSMIGNNSHNRKVFITQNIDRLQIDIARGDGEYLQTLAELYSCPEDNYSTFGHELKSHYEIIFNQSHKNKSSLDDFILNNSTLKNLCHDFIHHRT